MKKVAGYVRVSTDYQAEEGYSIGIQSDKIKKYCDIKDLGTCELYIDGGFSGAKLERPNIQKLIQDCEDKKISHVIVYKLDRLSRSQKDTMYLIEDVFKANDVEFISILENFDTTTPMGLAMIGLLSVFAQLERGQIYERTRSGMLARIKSGYWLGGSTIPYGYNYDANLNTLVPDPNTAENIPLIYDLYIEGYSPDAISKMLGLSTDALVRNILKRKSYLGIIEYKGEEYPGKHQPLITQKQYEDAQKCMKRRSVVPSTKKSNNLLTGLLYCGVCGTKMHYVTWNSKKRIICYTRDKYKKGKIHDFEKRCKNRTFIASEIEEQVVNTLLQISINLNKEEYIYNKTVDTIKKLEEQYKRTERKIYSLYDLYAENPSEILKKKINETQIQLDDIKNNISDEKNRNKIEKNNSKIFQNIKNLNDIWDSLTFDEKKSIIKEIVERIELVDDTINISLKI